MAGYQIQNYRKKNKKDKTKSKVTFDIDPNNSVDGLVATPSIVYNEPPDDSNEEHDFVINRKGKRSIIERLGSREIKDR